MKTAIRLLTLSLLSGLLLISAASLPAASTNRPVADVPMATPARGDGLLMSTVAGLTKRAAVSNVMDLAREHVGTNNNVFTGSNTFSGLNLGGTWHTTWPADGTNGAAGADGTNGVNGADGTNGAPGADADNFFTTGSYMDGETNAVFRALNALFIAGAQGSNATPVSGDGAAWMRMVTTNYNFGLWGDGLTLQLWAGENAATTPAFTFGYASGGMNESHLPLHATTLSADNLGGSGVVLSNVTFSGRVPVSSTSKATISHRVFLTNANLPTLSTWWNSNAVIVTSWEDLEGSYTVENHLWEVPSLRDYTSTNASFVVRIRRRGDGTVGNIGWILGWKP